MQKMYSGRIVYMQLSQNNLCAHADGKKKKTYQIMWLIAAGSDFTEITSAVVMSD